jgi:DNA-binding ferritin-like protein (Dps family)
MSQSNLLLYTTAELALLLLVVCVFLLLHVSKLRKLVAALEEKIKSLRVSIGKSRNETKRALKELVEKEGITSNSFLDYIEEEIAVTHAHHQVLNPDRDIVLDIALDAPIERQVSALRHAFLIAEKEARHNDGEDQTNWEVLQAKLQQIIEFYQNAQSAGEGDENSTGTDSADLIENYKSRITNLERFKKLFFDMEGKWESAKKQADDYHQQLLAMGSELGAGENFNTLLDNISTAYGEVGDLLAEASEAQLEGGGATIIDQRTGGVGKTVIANQEEIQRLKNMAVDQHKVITELKKKLYASDNTPEQQIQIVEALTEQLEQQQRFMKEAETCTQLLEDELTRAITENEAIRLQLADSEPSQSGASDEELEQIESVVRDLTNESKEMLGTIAVLEGENSSLKAQLEQGNTGGSGEHTDMLKLKLEEMQQELLNMQTQHIELEERYLDLKMK